MESIVSIVALIISILTFLTSTSFAIDRFLSQRLADRIKKIEVREKYFQEVTEWSNSVIEVIQKAAHFILVEPSNTNKKELLNMRESLRVECSILIDKGRWIFPNVEESDSHMFIGYGNEVLNCVVWIYKFISSIDTRNQENNWELRSNMLETKREFIDKVRNIINPSNRVVEYNKIVGD